MKNLKNFLKGDINMDFIIIFGIGILVGTIVTNIILRIFLVGTLLIKISDPNEGPYLFLELSKDTNVLTSKKYIILKVNAKSLFSHK